MLGCWPSRPDQRGVEDTLTGQGLHRISALYCRWAARAILIGHKEAALPTTNEQLQHLVESRSPDLYTYCKNFADLRLVHNLLWLLHAGQFKVLRSLATAPDNSRHSSEASSNQWGHPFANRSSISRHTPVRQMAGSILHLHSQPQPCKQVRFMQQLAL